MVTFLTDRSNMKINKGCKQTNYFSSNMVHTGQRCVRCSEVIQLEKLKMGGSNFKWAPEANSSLYPLAVTNYKK